MMTRDTECTVRLRAFMEGETVDSEGQEVFAYTEYVCQETGRHRQHRCELPSGVDVVWMRGRP